MFELFNLFIFHVYDAILKRADSAMITHKKVWVLSEAKMGMMNQAVGLAEALGWSYEIKTLKGRHPWTSLPVWLWPKTEHGQTQAVAETLQKPWPDMTISCGRRAAGVARWVKQQVRKEKPEISCFSVHIQDPLIDPKNFDLLILPDHDRLRGEAVVTYPGSLPHLTEEKITESVRHFAEKFAALPRPLLAVLIGGDNKVYRLSDACILKLADHLKALSGQGYGLLVSVSRRTGEAQRRLLENAMQDLPAYFWTGEGENPYFAYLGLADALLVTADSVNMVTEAAWTGKPVYVLEMEEKKFFGRSKGKFRRFHDSMRLAGYCRPFEGKIDHWAKKPLRNTHMAAEEIKKRFF